MNVLAALGILGAESKSAERKNAERKSKNDGATRGGGTDTGDASDDEVEENKEVDAMAKEGIRMVKGDTPSRRLGGPSKLSRVRRSVKSASRAWKEMSEEKRAVTTWAKFRAACLQARARDRAMFAHIDAERVFSSAAAPEERFTVGARGGVYRIDARGLRTSVNLNGIKCRVLRRHLKRERNFNIRHGASASFRRQMVNKGLMPADSDRDEDDEDEDDVAAAPVAAPVNEPGTIPAALCADHGADSAAGLASDPV